jgi:hypothetical protein
VRRHARTPRSASFSRPMPSPPDARRSSPLRRRAYAVRAGRPAERDRAPRFVQADRSAPRRARRT